MPEEQKKTNTLSTGKSTTAYITLFFNHKATTEEILNPTHVNMVLMVTLKGSHLWAPDVPNTSELRNAKGKRKA